MQEQLPPYLDLAQTLRYLVFRVISEGIDDLWSLQERRIDIEYAGRARSFETVQRLQNIKAAGFVALRDFMLGHPEYEASAIIGGARRLILAQDWLDASLDLLPSDGSSFGVQGLQHPWGEFRISAQAVVELERHISRTTDGQPEAEARSEASRSAVGTPAQRLPARPSQIGRPPKYDWGSFDSEVVNWVAMNDVPDVQADLVRHMATWCSNVWGADREPTESAIKARVAKLTAAARLSRNGRPETVG